MKGCRREHYWTQIGGTGRRLSKAYVPLLELAVWKASICDYDHFESLQEVSDYSALEDGFDSVEFVKQKRITRGGSSDYPTCHGILEEC